MENYPHQDGVFFTRVFQFMTSPAYRFKRRCNTSTVAFSSVTIGTRPSKKEYENLLVIAIDHDIHHIELTAEQASQLATALRYFAKTGHVHKDLSNIPTEQEAE
jgi:hypothetical protein